MNELQNIGVELSSLPFKLTHVRTLEYCDGERLCEYSSQVHTYLKVWFDCDPDANVDRWLIVRVESDVITTYLENNITLRDVIMQPANGIVYIVDELYSGGTARIAWLSPLLLSDDCLPTVNSYHRPKT